MSLYKYFFRKKNVVFHAREYGKKSTTKVSCTLNMYQAGYRKRNHTFCRVQEEIRGFLWFFLISVVKYDQTYEICLESFQLGAVKSIVRCPNDFLPKIPQLSSLRYQIFILEEFWTWRSNSYKAMLKLKTPTKFINF